jgi:PAS domain S-box-containing protein
VTPPPDDGPPLRFPAELLDLLVEAVPGTLAIIATDLEGTVTVWNDFAEYLYGWSPDEALGRRVDELTVGPVTQRVADDIMDRLRTGSHWSGTFDARRRDGSLVGIHILNAPVVDADGQVVGIVGFSRESVDRFEQAQQELDELRALAGHLDVVRREEARRIAAQIHDEFSQRFHLLIHRTADLAERPGLDAGVVAALGELQELERELVQVMHGVCGSLRPPLLDELGPAAAIEHLAESLGQRTLDVSAVVDPRLESLTPAIGDVVYAIAQEALANVLAHASATACSVSVRWGDDDVVTVEVVDDGVGYDGSPGFGVRLMSERARRAGGTFDVVRGETGGTVVLARLPARGPH